MNQELLLLLGYNTVEGIKKKIHNCPRFRKTCPYHLLSCLECMDITLPDETNEINCNFFGEGGEEK